MEGYALEMIGRMPFCSSAEIAGVLLRSLDEVRGRGASDESGWCGGGRSWWWSEGIAGANESHS